MSRLISVLPARRLVEIAWTLSLCSMPFFCGPCNVEENLNFIPLNYKVVYGIKQLFNEDK